MMIRVQGVGVASRCQDSLHVHDLSTRTGLPQVTEHRVMQLIHPDDDTWLYTKMQHIYKAKVFHTCVKND